MSYSSLSDFVVIPEVVAQVINRDVLSQCACFVRHSCSTLFCHINFGITISI